jgi:hypothetical protein
MPIEPKSIEPGKRYITATGHTRIALEVTEDRVRYAYGEQSAGGIGQWRWQTKAKFAAEVEREISADTPDESTPRRSRPR